MPSPVSTRNGITEFFAVLSLSKSASILLTENKEPIRLHGEIIEVFPEEARDNPLTRDLALFCLPQGVQITSQRQRPKSWPFVLTNVFGQRYYCVVLSFSEEFEKSSFPFYRSYSFFLF